jgi:tRNA-dihydrouridine synthase
MSITLISSPLQGFTDFRFRNAFNKYFGGIDTFYAPYIRFNGTLEIKSSYERDLNPKNNIGIDLVPQVMANNADEFLFAAKYVQSIGYNELNWNLGCPYPMVTNRGLGSGLICQPEKINSILNRVFAESDITVSIKMRLGYASSEEIFQVLPILEEYPVKCIAIHPRIGKQLYKGSLDLNSFERCLSNTSHKVYYNGDIVSVAVFNKLASQFPTINHWLIGRGVIADPFLPGMIKNNTSIYPENRVDIFSKFHDTLFSDYSQALSGSSHILTKMLHFWEYFITSFSNPHKGFKKIKKAKNIGAYEATVRDILSNERQTDLSTQ